MKVNIYISIVIILTLLLSSCTGTQREIREEPFSQNDNESIEDRKEDMTDPIVELIKDMDLEQKIGQLFIIGFNGTSINDWMKDMIGNYYIGGFILFKENMTSLEQALELLNGLKEENKANSIPLFLSIDEEGGRVHRLPKPFLKMPPAKEIGDIDDENISFQYGKILARRIKSLGFNMNFAPVMDINSNPKNPVIGDRSFGSSGDIVSYNGIQVMEGIRSENIISIIKHFPGHGDTSTDSHWDLPMVDKDLKQLRELELIPFLKGIESGVDGIMIGHIMFPKIDDIYPATLSKEIMTNLLRKELSFDKVIISDDMTMGAIAKNYTIEDAVIKYLKAGGDIILICHGEESPIKAIGRIKEEIEKGNITEEEIDEKVYRILKLKEKYNISNDPIQEIDIQSINQDTKCLLNKIEEFKINRREKWR